MRQLAPIDRSVATTGVVPQLVIRKGTVFGYRFGPPFRKKTKALASVTEELFFKPGLHLFVAPNGAGKTTILRTLARLNPPLSGGVHVVGRVFYLSDFLQLDGELSALELFQSWFETDAFGYALQLSRMLRLDLGCQIRRLSRGNRQKVGLIVTETLAAHSRPSILLLDEPLTGLDAQTREVVAGLWAESGPSVLRLVVLHELEAIRNVSSLCTVVRGCFRHTSQRVGESWGETCEYLRGQ